MAPPRKPAPEPKRSPVPLPPQLTTALASGSPVFVKVGASWCGPCKVLTAKVLPTPEVQRALAGYTVLELDFDDPVVEEAVAAWGGQGVPFLAAFQPPDEVPVKAKSGLQKPADLAAWIP